MAVGAMEMDYVNREMFSVIAVHLPFEAVQRALNGGEQGIIGKKQVENSVETVNNSL